MDNSNINWKPFIISGILNLFITIIIMLYVSFLGYGIGCLAGVIIILINYYGYVLIYQTNEIEKLIKESKKHV